MRSVRWLVALLALAGCTTLGEPYSPPPPMPEGKARVYLLRSAVGYGNFWTTVFSVNDTEAISLYDKGYSWIYLDPGTYKFSAGTVMKYFIEYNQEPGGYQRFRNVIRAVNPTVGSGLVQKYACKAADKQDFQPAAKQ